MEAGVRQLDAGIAWHDIEVGVGDVWPLRDEELLACQTIAIDVL